MTIQLLDPQVGRKTSRADAPVQPLRFRADAPVPPLLSPAEPSLISSLISDVRDFLLRTCVLDALTPAQREQTERIGDLSFKSSRPVWDPAACKFIPSREKH